MNLLLAPLLLQGLATGPVPEAKLHPYLVEQLAAAEDSAKLPVYFVMGDQLGYEDFMPRVRRMDPASRRELVVSELKDHMEFTQRDLMTTFSSRSGEVDIISRNWLGNFVRAEATPSAILSAAAIDGVSEVWYDYVPAMEEVLDVAPAPAGGRVIPGNGPLDTRAAEVWATGVQGAGVVWMNADSGVRASQTNATSIHKGLVGRLWVNPGEIFNNGIDDDANGKVDDYYGWDFGGDNSNIDDSGGHGTNCAGVFVGRDPATETEYGNTPRTKIMTAQLSGESSQWDAVQYAIAEGAHGQTSSHSYKMYFNPPPNYAMHRTVGETSLAAGLIRTNSTSNDGGSCNSGSSSARRPFNISAPGNLPAPWIHPDQTLEGGLGGVLGIGAHDVGSSTPTQPSYTPCGPFAWNLPDVLSVNSSYPTANWNAAHNDYPWTGGSQLGLLKPDLTGPTGTRTTSGSNGYTNFSGTSNATPSVSSCLALAFSANTSLSPEDMAMAAQTTAVDYGAAGKDTISGAGKVDAWELTKMARAIHRVNGDVAHTQTYSVGAGGTLDFELDSLPNTFVYPMYGLAPDNNVIGELTVRVASPTVVGAFLTDAQGNFAISLPLNPGLIGTDIWTQFAVSDPDFGPLTGSNAVNVTVTP